MHFTHPSSVHLFQLCSPNLWTEVLIWDIPSFWLPLAQYEYLDWLKIYLIWTRIQWWKRMPISCDMIHNIIKMSQQTAAALDEQYKLLSEDVFSRNVTSNFCTDSSFAISQFNEIFSRVWMLKIILIKSCLINSIYYVGRRSLLKNLFINTRSFRNNSFKLYIFCKEVICVLECRCQFLKYALHKRLSRSLEILFPQLPYLIQFISFRILSEFLLLEMQSL